MITEQKENTISKYVKKKEKKDDSLGAHLIQGEMSLQKVNDGTRGG